MSDDIATVVGRYVALSPLTPILESGACPFHEDRDARLRVNRQMNRFVCVGCGITGNAVDFVAEFEMVTREDARQQLRGLEADWSSDPIPTPTNDAERSALDQQSLAVAARLREESRATIKALSKLRRGQDLAPWRTRYCRKLRAWLDRIELAISVYDFGPRPDEYATLADAERYLDAHPEEASPNPISPTN